MRKTYNKLVRDKVIGRLMQLGKKPEFERHAAFDRKLHLLFSKLPEENKELVEAIEGKVVKKICEEIVDAIQIYVDIGKMFGLSADAIERYRRTKLANSGGFTNGDFLISADE